MAARQLTFHLTSTSTGKRPAGITNTFHYLVETPVASQQALISDFLTFRKWRVDSVDVI